MKLAWVVVIVVLSTFQMGCATYMNSFNVKVKAQSRLPKSDEIVTYKIERFPEQEDSLEHEDFENLLRHGLEKYSWTEAGESEKPDYIVKFQYGISREKNIGSNPIMGKTGVASSSTTTSHYSNSSYSTTNYSPSYGVVGSQTYSYDTFPADFSISIYKMSRAPASERPQKVYEARASLETESIDSVDRALFFLVSSVFQTFPKNGSRDLTYLRGKRYEFGQSWGSK